MSHEWHAGVLSTSSWHGLETVEILTDAESLIDAGERSGAWPVSLDSEAIQTVSGLACPDHHAIVGSYRNAFRRPLGVVGGRYRATTPTEWRDTCRAAILAGAKPTGAFALRGGSRVLATFEVDGNGIRNQLLVCDAFDGSMKLTCGTTAIRVVCANTLAMSLGRDGDGMVGIRHTASLETKIKVLQENISVALAKGETVRETFAAAERVQLDRDSAKRAFDALFPEAPADASPGAKTRAENLRYEARRAVTLPINQVGTQRGNLATLWNAATYLVDRHADGTPRAVRGGDVLESMLFGQRGDRVQEIQTMIEVILRDGKVQPMTATQAIDAGVDLKQVGAKVLQDILND
jgi:uncharacterized protein DUF932